MPKVIVMTFTVIIVGINVIAVEDEIYCSFILLLHNLRALLNFLSRLFFTHFPLPARFVCVGLHTSERV